MHVFPNDWGAILLPQAPLLELVARGTAIYIFLFIVLRIVDRRQYGGIAVSDFLVVLLIATAVRNGLTSDYTTIGDAIVSGLTLILWDHAVNALAFHIRPLRDLLREKPMPVILHGDVLRDNAREQLLTLGEIREKLREHGIESVRDVDAAYIEPDGSFSVIQRTAS
ncbi:MAG TPA: YetF domain-containing protein [Longimicrobiales bacterium]|nr:YetF domain-containing protein [Longimicrobiales bacterium]